MSVSIWTEDRKNKNGTYKLLRWEVRENGVRVKEKSGAKAYFTKESLEDAIPAKRRQLKGRGSNYQGMTIKEYAEEFYRCRESWETDPYNVKEITLKEVTRQKDKNNISKFVEFLGPDKILKEITTKDIRDFNIWLKTKPWKNQPGYCHNGRGIILKSIRTLLLYAYHNEYIERPVKFAIPRGEPVGRAATREELDLLWSNLSKKAKDAYVFQYYMCCRSSDLLQARWEKVRIKDGRKQIEIGGLARGQEGKEGERPKADSDGYIEIHPYAWQAMGGVLKKTGPIFDISRSWLSHAISKTAKKLGIGRFRDHDLRHSMATQFMEEYGDLRALQAFGRWRSLDSLNGYNHITPKRASLHLAMDADKPIPEHRTHQVRTKDLKVA